MDFKDLKRGDFVTFTATKIIDGNPIEGIFVSQNEDYIKIKLLKTCKGEFNSWFKGEFKQFKNENVFDLKKID
jgi:hypothetical protein